MMANPVLNLPRAPLESTLVVTPEQNTLEFKGDTGSGIRRQMYTGARDIYTFDVQLHSDSERDDLFEFYKTDCGGGSLRFDMEDVQFLGESPPNIREFSWIDPVTIRRIAPGINGGIYVASFNLAREPE
jgi:hypothetical protein